MGRFIQLAMYKCVNLRYNERVDKIRLDICIAIVRYAMKDISEIYALGVISIRRETV